MAEKRPKRPRDPSQLAKYILDVATGEKRASNKPQAGKRKPKRIHATPGKRI